MNLNSSDEAAALRAENEKLRKVVDYFLLASGVNTEALMKGPPTVKAAEVVGRQFAITCRVGEELRGVAGFEDLPGRSDLLEVANALLAKGRKGEER